MCVSVLNNILIKECNCVQNRSNAFADANTDTDTNTFTQKFVTFVGTSLYTALVHRCGKPATLDKEMRCSCFTVVYHHIYNKIIYFQYIAGGAGGQIGAPAAPRVVSASGDGTGVATTSRRPTMAFTAMATTTSMKYA